LIEYAIVPFILKQVPVLGAFKLMHQLPVTLICRLGVQPFFSLANSTVESLNGDLYFLYLNAVGQ